MRRFLSVAALLLCLGAVGCDKDQALQGAAAAAGAAETSPIPTVALIGSIASGLLAAFGVKRAGAGVAAAKFTETGWTRDDLSELIDALEKAPDQAMRFDKAMEKARKGAV